MTREERLKYCTVCELKDFNPKTGIICSLTGKVAAFEDTCPDFKEDEKALVLEQKKDREQEEETAKFINFGRYALFALGVIYLIFAIYKTFITEEYNAFGSFIYWTVTVTFFTLGFWSREKPLLAYQVGLGFYITVLLFHGLFAPETFLIGLFPFVGYFAVVCVFLAAITTVKSEKNKSKH